MKKLKLWNGRSHGHKYYIHHVYVAARSMAEAARLVSMACFDGLDYVVKSSEIKEYYSHDTWGDRMIGIEPTEPCVYVCDENSSKNKPFRVI